MKWKFGIQINFPLDFLKSFGTIIIMNIPASELKAKMRISVLLFVCLSLCMFFRWAILKFFP